jgi:hypothetical protein
MIASEVKLLFVFIMLALAGYGGYSLYSWGWDSRNKDYQAHLKEDKANEQKRQAAFEANVAREQARTATVKADYDRDVNILAKRLQERPDLYWCQPVRVAVTPGMPKVASRVADTSPADAGAKSFYARALADALQLRAVLEVCP